MNESLDITAARRLMNVLVGSDDATLVDVCKQFGVVENDFEGLASSMLYAMQSTTPQFKAAREINWVAVQECLSRGIGQTPDMQRAVKVMVDDLCLIGALSPASVPGAHITLPKVDCLYRFLMYIARAQLVGDPNIVVSEGLIKEWTDNSGIDEPPE